MKINTALKWLRHCSWGKHGWYFFFWNSQTWSRQRYMYHTYNFYVICYYSLQFDGHDMIMQQHKLQITVIFIHDSNCTSWMHEKSLQILKKESALLGFQLHAFKKLPNSAFEINCVWKNSIFLTSNHWPTLAFAPYFKTLYI